MSWSLQNYQLPGDNIAFAFSDAAGANAAVAMYWLQQGSKNLFLFSNKANYPDLLKELIVNSIPDFKALNISCLFTGTSHPESSDYFEVECIRKAKASGVYVISFIDHWINFRLRFNTLSPDQLPDEIWVVDENARTLAVKEGLPAGCIRVSGNPYQFFLSEQWKPTYSGKSYLNRLNIPEDGLHILFAPDPFSIRELYKKTGFTEDEALHSLLEVVQGQEGIFLIIKMHPLQPEEPLKKMLEQSEGVSYKLVKDADVPELIHACDLVVGFYSNLLLDALAMNKKLIRYFPGNPSADLLANSHAVAKPLTNPIQLQHQILSFIHEHSFPKR